jgi:ABC-2 type transport system ATP-binding protein
MSYAIELERVTKRFGKQVAVDRLDLRVPLGSIYGFIGPNGSGKTTTLRMILRIIQPDSGIVRVLGRQTGTTADDSLGYLPEERGLYKRMRVDDLLIFFARLKGVRDPRAVVYDWLRQLDADAWARKRVDMLSKGMAQKIQFITSVVAHPKLVVLDEPFSGLDPVNLEVIRAAILRLRDRGATVIFSTHDMGIAERMCDTLFMIFRGRKVLDGTLDEIQTSYPANRLRIRLDNGQDLPALDQVTETERNGRFFELTLADSANPQQVLSQLVQRCTITHFEVVKPSLHDIFVHIAKPQQYALEEALEA